MRALIAATLTLLVALGACTGSGPDRGSLPGGQPGGVMLASALGVFDACEELLDHVTTHALDLVGPWGLGGHGPVMPLPEIAVEEDTAADAERVAGAPVEGVDFSATNIQERGVDEPDRVKTDGERLYLAQGEQLHVVDLTGGAPELLASVELGGSELLLAGDRLLVIGSGGHGGIRPLPEPGDLPPDGGGTRLALYDVADPARPELVSSLELDGRALSARLVDGVARVVLRAEPVGLDFHAPEGTGLRAEREATERNREIIRSSTVDDWVPYYVRTDATGREEEGTLVPCDRVHHPEEFAGLGTTSVLSLDLDGDLSPTGTTSVLAGGDTVYASPERLYVATNRWVDWEALTEREARDASERFTTDLHAFDITVPDAARYVGSGTVRGRVLDQWGLSAHEGVLRVATTDGAPWWGAGETTSESFVTTFAEEDGALVELGQVGGLGPEERIYAVRFMGDLGFVVTFRETDPLYTVDLSDPADPRVLGELKIMGYSAYLHPVGDGLLLGVGQDADERGMTEGLQLSLFDVSDLGRPARIHQVTLADTHSGVEWDHRAFLHWPATGHVVVPFETWRWDDEAGIDEATSGALAYTVDIDEGFTEAARITHVPDEAEADGRRLPEPVYRAQIQRSLVVGDTLYTVSDLGVKANTLGTFEERGWLALPAPGR